MGSQGPSIGPGLQKPFFPVKKMKENKLLKALVLRGPCSLGEKKKTLCPTQQAYDLLELQSYKQCFNNMKQETPPISSSKQALFFLEVGRGLGERVRLVYGAQAWNWRPRYEKALCLCPQLAGQVWGQQVCPLCAHPRGLGSNTQAGRSGRCPLAGQGLETRPELSPGKPGCGFLTSTVGWEDTGLWGVGLAGRVWGGP